MPYTPTGGYYTTKGRLPHSLPMRGNKERWAVMVCFEGPHAKQKAMIAKKSIHNRFQTSKRNALDYASLATLGLQGACCLAIHDCCKHKLNPKC